MLVKGRQKYCTLLAVVTICTPQFLASCCEVGWKQEKYFMTPFSFQNFQKFTNGCQKTSGKFGCTLQSMVIFLPSYFCYFCILLHLLVIFCSWHLWSFSASLTTSKFFDAESVTVAHDLTPVLVLQFFYVENLTQFFFPGFSYIHFSLLQLISSFFLFWFLPCCSLDFYFIFFSPAISFSLPSLSVSVICYYKLVSLFTSLSFCV